MYTFTYEKDTYPGEILRQRKEYFSGIYSQNVSKHRKLYLRLVLILINT
jgi:hypothetical protein